MSHGKGLIVLSMCLVIWKAVNFINSSLVLLFTYLTHLSFPTIDSHCTLFWYGTQLIFHYIGLDITLCNCKQIRVRGLVFTATFNNISGILWWSVLLVDETGVPGNTIKSADVLVHEYANHCLQLQVTDKLNVVSSIPRRER